MPSKVVFKSFPWARYLFLAKTRSSRCLSIRDFIFSRTRETHQRHEQTSSLELGAYHYLREDFVVLQLIFNVRQDLNRVTLGNVSLPMRATSGACHSQVLPHLNDPLDFRPVGDDCGLLQHAHLRSHPGDEGKLPSVCCSKFQRRVTDVASCFAGLTLKLSQIQGQFQSEQSHRRVHHL